MQRTIRWSRNARQNFLDLLLYLQENWGDEKAIAFHEKVETIIQSILQFPFQYPAYRLAGNQKIRKCVVSKQTSLFYKVEAETIDLLAFFDHRQDPDSLILES